MAILMTCFIKDDDDFYPQLILEKAFLERKKIGHGFSIFSSLTLWILKGCLLDPSRYVFLVFSYLLNFCMNFSYF